MDLGLKDRVALVCGASKGLGRAVADGLAREGAGLAICSRSEENIRKAASEISNQNSAEVLGLRPQTFRGLKRPANFLKKPWTISAESIS